MLSEWENKIVAKLTENEYGLTEGVWAKPIAAPKLLGCCFTDLVLAWTSLAFLLAKTWMWLETCFLVRVFPVRSLMYRAISSFLPTGGKGNKLVMRSDRKWRPKWVFQEIEGKKFFSLAPHLSFLSYFIVERENGSFRSIYHLFTYVTTVWEIKVAKKRRERKETGERWA